MSINYPAQHYICYTHTLVSPWRHIIKYLHNTALYICYNQINISDPETVMKVKVADLEGLLTQNCGIIVMKVKVEDPEDLGGSSNIQEYMLLSC